MGKSVDAVDPTFIPVGGRGCDLLGGAADAAYRRQYPDLVAGRDPTVGAAIAEKDGRLAQGQAFSRERFIGIAFEAAQQGREIMAVDMLARQNRGSEPADRP